MAGANFRWTQGRRKDMQAKVKEVAKRESISEHEAFERALYALYEFFEEGHVNYLKSYTNATLDGARKAFANTAKKSK